LVARPLEIKTEEAKEGFKGSSFKDKKIIWKAPIFFSSLYVTKLDREV